MDLYLIRHGIAAERGRYPQDEDRPLVDKGMRRSRSVAQRLYHLGLQFDLLLTSPLVRAQQTAEILCQENLASNFQVIPALAPGGELTTLLEQTKQAWMTTDASNRSPQASMKESKAFGGKRNRRAIAWVGHQPELSHWAETLVWNSATTTMTQLEHETIILKKAGMIGLHFPSNWQQESPLGKVELFWLTPPRLLL